MVFDIASEKPSSEVEEAYAPENFELFAEICTQKITEYLKKNIYEPENNPVFSLGLTPQKAEQRFSEWLDSTNSVPAGEQFSSFIDLILENSMHLHHPHYVGHQVAPVLPLAAVVDMLAAILNNSSVVFEMGPMEAVLEKYMIRFFANRMGWIGADSPKFGGFFTSGGSLGNLSALLAARNRVVQEQGALPGTLGVIVSEESHYSIIRSLRIMGISDAHIFKVSSREITQSALKESLEAARENGISIFATIVNACSTATGTFDNIQEAVKFCEQEKIWLHVDAAHGGAAVLSDRLRSLLKGIERADSIIIDAHKMMLMPALLTAVIFRDCKDPARSCPDNAAFLFDDAQENDWYTLGRQTLECTKKMMVLKLFISVHLYGEKFFADYVEHCYDLGQCFYDLLNRSTSLEPLKRPEFNIVCFRVKHGNTALQLKIRDALLSQGEFYIVSAGILGETYLRCTIINPRTTETVLRALIKRVEELASSYRHNTMLSSSGVVTCSAGALN